ncbi:hypothetical protein [Mesorhizobium sp. B2-1-3A]|uniref:hypothetical protein n=1 Tax=Mesorhizobium sp. B2-1-3A TaxID=2589971 RepID=UPI001FEFF996|nr:hypothetical protein [Mesorhizobium sp. B2-1-3A]
MQLNADSLDLVGAAITGWRFALPPGITLENAPPQRIPGLGDTSHALHIRHRRSLGLAIGGAFGLAGTFVASAPLRETLWKIDGVALVVATALLTMKYQRLGYDCVAAARRWLSVPGADFYWVDLDAGEGWAMRAAARRRNPRQETSVGAAPHCPAGHFSP